MQSLGRGSAHARPTFSPLPRRIVRSRLSAGRPPRSSLREGTDAVYVVWQDARFNGFDRDQVAFSKSSDGGLTWSRLARSSSNNATQAFTPSIDVNSHGRVAVTYYDFTNDTPASPTLDTDYWVTRSRDGGETFGRRERITESPFGMRLAPFAGGFFVGDYEGLASQRGFKPLFVQTDGRDPAKSDRRVLDHRARAADRPQRGEPQGKPDEPGPRPPRRAPAGTLRVGSSEGPPGRSSRASEWPRPALTSRALSSTARSSWPALAPSRYVTLRTLARTRSSTPSRQTAESSPRSRHTRGTLSAQSPRTCPSPFPRKRTRGASDLIGRTLRLVIRPRT
jgi:hypothetical protein